MLDKVTAVFLPHSFGTYPSNLLAPSWSEMTDTANRFINCVSTEDTSKSPTPAQQAQTARISEHLLQVIRRWSEMFLSPRDARGGHLGQALP